MGTVRGDHRPAVSVIIPCLNAADTIRVQLEALARQEFSKPWELIVSDGGSADGTLDILEEFQDRLPLQIVDSSGRRGNAHARNVGVRAAQAPALAFCDADDEVGHGWLSAIAEGLERHEFVSSRVDVVRLNASWLRYYRPHTSDQLPLAGFPPHIPFPGSCSLGVRRSLYERLEGFDEYFHLADDDLGFRAQRIGIELTLLQNAVIHIRHRSRLRDIYRQAASYQRDWAAFQKLYADPPVEVSYIRWLLYGWKWILRALPGLRHREGRAYLAWRLGLQMGRYQGSKIHRVRSMC